MNMPIQSHDFRLSSNIFLLPNLHNFHRKFWFLSARIAPTKYGKKQNADIRHAIWYRKTTNRWLQQVCTGTILNSFESPFFHTLMLNCFTFFGKSWPTVYHNGLNVTKDFHHYNVQRTNYCWRFYGISFDCFERLRWYASQLSPQPVGD